jgi:RNA polymerase II elongation factor ELL
LYSASTELLGGLNFAGIVGHKAELKLPERKQSEGSDAALAALQNTLASYQQEKQAKAVNITSSVIAAPENRFKAAKEHKQAQRRGLMGSQPTSPSMSAANSSRLGLPPTSMPTTDSAVRLRAMRTPLVHLLAMKPLARDDIIRKTRIPKDDLDEILKKIGKQEDGKWQLTDRAYKDLDVYKFGYLSHADRQAAVDNAIRAYDRMRIGKDDKIWQMLLPREDRDKGMVLSKLHLSAGNRNGLTPSYASSPMLGGDADKGASTANTPKLGPSSTPKVPAAASGGMKRLFAKDPKKARAAEEAKDKKRKEREVAAATSDKEGGNPVRKRQATKANNPKVKSAELVHSSDDDSEPLDESKKSAGPSSSQLKAPPSDRKPVPSAATKPKPKAAVTASPSSKDNPGKLRQVSKATTPSTVVKKAVPTNGTKNNASTTTTSSTTSKITKSNTVGKATPNGRTTSSQQQRPQLSPQDRSSRPTVPSPLGAARPRLASDVSDRAAVGVQRVRHGAETPKGLGITTNGGGRKRQDTVMSTDSSSSGRLSVAGKKPPTDSRKPATNGTTPSKPITNGVASKSDTGIKRKALHSPSSDNDERPPSKHRKTESNSSQSQKSHSGSTVASGSAETRERSVSSIDSTNSVTDTITFTQGVNLAEQFRDYYYPKYTKLYDEQVALEARGERVPREERQRLWKMHRRLEQMKREIKAASLREFDE